MIIIAEVKTKSPFGYVSDKTFDDLFEIAEMKGDWISIHTDSRWGGNFDDIIKVKNLTEKPILAKGIHVTDFEIEKAINNGADYVLVVGRIPNIDLISRCLIEPNTLKELSKIPENIKTVWNSRDLSTGKLKKETFNQARSLFDGWLCQASNIKNKIDINEKADAILVGEHLEHYDRISFNN